MPDSEIELVSKEWLQAELRSNRELIVLDCRNNNEYSQCHVRSAVNFSIPSIMLRRLAAGKIDIAHTIKCKELKNRIIEGLKNITFVLYNNDADLVESNNNSSSDLIQTVIASLSRDGAKVLLLQDSFSSFRAAFPEWCEEVNSVTNAKASANNNPCSRSTPTEQLMGLRSLRISTPLSDSTCSSSAESSDCESTSHLQVHGAPVEILPGLFLGNASHSEDSRALQKYNIRYILNVTPDLPNVFEEAGGIEYLQIPITDHWSQDLATHFPAAIQFIDEARSKGGAVLVHCLAGVSRSVTVTLAYLMHARSLCLNDAFSLVRARKPDVSPNFHFMEQLHSFERQLKSNTLRTPSSSTSSALSSPLSGMQQGKFMGKEQYKSMRASKYSCACIEVECKCMQTDFLSMGVSPDSGIEFDRWTPGDTETPK